jgi:hypothetical protein
VVGLDRIEQLDDLAALDLRDRPPAKGRIDQPIENTPALIDRA